MGGRKSSVVPSLDVVEDWFPIHGNSYRGERGEVILTTTYYIIKPYNTLILAQASS